MIGGSILSKHKKCLLPVLKPSKMPRFIGLILACIVLFIAILCVGSYTISPSDVLSVLTGGKPQDLQAKEVIWAIRLPRALTAFLAGAGLSVAGLMMQTLFRNPLAGPFVLGIESGASLGIALAIMSVSFGAWNGLWGAFGLVFAASLGAGVVLILVLMAAARIEGNTTLLILGMLFGYATGALVSILVQFSSAEKIRQFSVWGLGSFNGVTSIQVLVFSSVIAIGIGLSFALNKPMNGLLLGLDYAASLGISIRKIRFLLILATALLAGAVTAFCGPIGFLGLAVPHLARWLFKTSDHHRLTPAVLLLGALLAMLADLLTLLPGERGTLPLNAVTALLGAPVIFWVILRPQRHFF